MWWGSRTTAAAVRTVTAFRRRCRCRQDANIEGSQDLSCDISGNTEGQGDCHLLVADRDEQKLYELYQANQVR